MPNNLVTAHRIHRHSNDHPGTDEGEVEAALRTIERSAVDQGQHSLEFPAPSVIVEDLPPLTHNTLNHMRRANSLISAHHGEALVESYFKGPLHAGWFVS
jgi:hypothetical protein